MKDSQPKFSYFELLAAAFLALPVLAMAATPEQVFENAEDYTVRIQTRIEKALGDDEAGVYSGTGFVVDAKRGWIVTNKHVVGESPSHVQVALKGQPYLDATKVYIDPYTDIAVLRAPLEHTRAAKLECKNLPVTGHPVGAYGHPWGLEYTGTQGVISGRTDEFGADLLQTDAPINAGNSGGPLISMRSGGVVGIGTASFDGDDAENTNFAVPITEVCQILRLLIDERDPSPPKLDIAFYNLRDREELVIARSYVDPDMIDLRSGDKILSAGSENDSITKQHELINALRGELDRVKMTVERDSRIVHVEGRLPPRRIRNGVVFAGMVLASFGLRDASTIPAGHDIMVHSFVDGAIAEAVGITQYDFLVSVNGKIVKRVTDVYKVLSHTEPGSMVSLEFLRWFEDSQLFQYVLRDLVADEPEWLGEKNFWDATASLQ
jgi:S1-C subfamily serine protease